MVNLHKFIISGCVSSLILTNIPDLSVLWDVLISFAISFITILGSKFINYLSKKIDNSIDLHSTLTEDDDDVVQEEENKK